MQYDDGWYKNLSVISNKTHHNVKLGQFIVSYNQKSGTLDCDCCCCRKQTCVHSVMSLWFFQQNKMLNEVNIKINDNILPPPTTDRYCGIWDECSPSQNQEKLITLKYIWNKKYKKDKLKAYRTFNLSAAPTSILPLEQVFHLCCGNISKALSVSTIDKIMTLQGLFWKI